MIDLFEEFQEFRKILCICPCCSELVRVSDLRLKTKGPAPRTWIDDFEKLDQALNTKINKFEEKEEKLRELARERGRKQPEIIFNNAIIPALKALKLDPFDIKPIMNPVDFVVFKGMNKEGAVSDIIMLSRKCASPTLNTLRQQVKTSVINKNYEWQVARIDDKGTIQFE